MRTAALALAVLGVAACRRGTLEDDGGPGTLPGDDGPGATDGRGATDLATDLGNLPDGAFPTADANCGMISVSSNYLAPEILVVQDRAIAADVTQWNDFLSSMATIISNNGSRVDWGLYTFPQNGPACGAGTLSTAIDVQIIPDNASQVIAHMGAAGTGASATPTAAAIERAGAYLGSLQDQNPKFFMLLTDGAPTCAGALDPIVADPAQAQADAVTIIDGWHGLGIPTLVVAPSTTAADVDALNALAEAGGYPQPPPGPKFFTELTIGQSLTLTDLATTCVFSLGPTRPPVPDLVTVTVNGAVVSRDPSHVSGWDYTDRNAAAIEIYGVWCDQLHTTRSSTVSIYFGCPGDG